MEQVGKAVLNGSLRWAIGYDNRTGSAKRCFWFAKPLTSILSWFQNACKRFGAERATLFSKRRPGNKPATRM